MSPVRVLVSGAVVVALSLSAACGSSAPVAVPCQPRVDQGVLPVWARSGFTDPAPRMPHVLGASGNIAAIIFDYPLLSPPSEARSNKVLWVSRVPTTPRSDLLIEAQRIQGSQPVGPALTRTVTGGPGPSEIDLPSPGCWRLTLRWSGHVDTLDLQYRASP